LEEDILRQAMELVDGMTREEIRKLLWYAKGDWCIKELIQIGDTVIYAEGFENSIEPDSYELRYKQDLVYSSESLKSVLCSANFPQGVEYSQEELDIIKRDEFYVYTQW
jgi:hypothetical protein